MKRSLMTLAAVVLFVAASVDAQQKPGTAAEKEAAEQKAAMDAMARMAAQQAEAVARAQQKVAEEARRAEEERLRARDGLAQRPADRKIAMPLTGEMTGYRWGLTDPPGEGMPSFDVAAGERVEVTFENRTSMSHPMHLHGHVFQVVGIDGRRFQGALRDTVLVPHHGTVTIAFEADNPGEWMLHCHNLYHMAAGMMATLRYS